MRVLAHHHNQALRRREHLYTTFSSVNYFVRTRLETSLLFGKPVRINYGLVLRRYVQLSNRFQGLISKEGQS
jgi:hypothetical protein